MEEEFKRMREMTENLKDKLTEINDIRKKVFEKVPVEMAQKVNDITGDIDVIMNHVKKGEFDKLEKFINKHNANKNN